MTYINAIEITPSDLLDADHELHVDAIVLDASGTLVCQLWGDSAPVSIEGLAAGRIYPLQVKYIKFTGTDASDIIGLRAGRMST